MGDIVLFDMDGTLTPARQTMSENVKSALIELSKIAEIGVLTGSDLDYLLQQIPVHELGTKILPTQSIHLLPCNGTRYLRRSGHFDLAKEFEVVSSVNMRERIIFYDMLMANLLKMQHEFASEKNRQREYKFGLTGHFISARSGMINWCPIGRNATQKDRESFIEFDQATNFRECSIQKLKAWQKEEMSEVIDMGTVEFALGGETSFDIFPSGWDKTYALRHFPGRRIWFVGDRCVGKGNDRKIYEALEASGRSFMTSGPDETIKIIRNRLISEIE
ncbi:MAG: HAD-IIB family hydrolase [Candidatus Thorarchaeota archaeon]|jgi:phosphomannomutase